MSEAFVLLSGGIDSTTCLYLAAEQHDKVHAVSIDYGQRHKRELEFAKRSADSISAGHSILDVGDLLSGKEVLLSAESIGTRDMVHKSYDEIKGLSPSYVPFRNGLLLSAITAHAQKHVNKWIQERQEFYFTSADHLVTEEESRHRATLDAKDHATVYFGAHAEDAANWAYPDCTPEFNGAMANAIYTGSYNTIRLATPLQWMAKYQIIQCGEELDVPWHNTWSCYDNLEVHCGRCPTCLARRRAFVVASVEDPTEYLV